MMTDEIKWKHRWVTPKAKPYNSPLHGSGVISKEKINKGEYPKNHKRYKLNTFKLKDQFISDIQSDLGLFDEILKKLHTQYPQGFIDLIYIDPPFDSGANYVRQVELRGINKKTKLDFNLVKSFSNNEFTEYGLSGDNYNDIKNILIDESSDIILSPHDGDIFLLETGMKIKLEARDVVSWYLDSKLIEKSKETIISFNNIGKHAIEAIAKDKTSQKISIFIVQ